MHYVITNPTPGKILGITPGDLRNVSHEEMSKLAVAVARCMAPVAQRLVPTTDAQGQPASKAVMGPNLSALRIHCFAVDEGEKTELDAKSLLEIYADDIKAAKAARSKLAEERRAARRSR